MTLFIIIYTIGVIFAFISLIWNEIYKQKECKTKYITFTIGELIEYMVVSIFSWIVVFVILFSRFEYTEIIKFKNKKK